MQVNLDKFTELAQSVATSFGLDILDIKFGQQGKRRTVEVTLFKRTGRISLSDCEQVSRTLDEKLDQHSPPLIDSSFLLEVQSPGIDRKLTSEREFTFFAGQPVHVKTKQKIDGLGCEFTGTLVGLVDGNVLISQPQKATGNEKPRRKSTKAEPEGSCRLSEPLVIEMSNVIQVQLHPQMPKDSDDTKDLSLEVSGPQAESTL